MKELAKRILYHFKSYDFPDDFKLQLAYIFHTEQFYDRATYEKLLRFCIQYKKITGKKPITTIMSGMNARVVEGCRAHGLSSEEYADRARELGEVSTVGYHGHFWIDPLRTEERDSQMRNENFSLTPFLAQFEADRSWFEEYGLDHHGIYSAGWWFMNESVIAELIHAGFTTDFSFSYFSHFQNPYSFRKMRDAAIRVGEPFRFDIDKKSILCIQNFIGCHPSPYFGDFKRNFLKLAKNERNLIGVVNSHDYDLNEPSTLDCIEALSKLTSVEFLDAGEIIQVSSQKHLKRLSPNPKN